ncbi:MAG: hypothetical protein Q8903_12615 [Bacteroidota bacterium]|nr:hypothetical protein [Bacteroidota bacterium]
MKKFSLSILAILLFATITSAQTAYQGKVGIGIDGVNSPNLALKYCFSDKVSSEFILGLGVYSPGGDASVGQTKVTGTDFRIGASVLYNLTQGDFIPYVGVEALYETNKSGGFYVKEPDAKNSVHASLVLGGEYFIAKQFSLGLKEKIGADIQLKRDVPKEETDFYLNTATVVTARFYFN